MPELISRQRDAIAVHRRLAAEGFAAEVADPDGYVDDGRCAAAYARCPRWYRAWCEFVGRTRNTFTR